jgi:hypothetical protein
MGNTNSPSNAARTAREQKVRYYEGSWVEANLALSDQGILTVTIGKAAKVIDIPPFVEIGPPIIGVFPGVFVIHSEQESEYSTGPRFACKKQEDTDRWIQLLRFVELKKRLNLRHNHPLTPCTVEKKCNVCKKENTRKKLSETDGGDTRPKCWTCEFCQDYAQCLKCHSHLENFTSPLVQSPNHNHQLLKLNSAQGSWVEQGYNGVYECDICGTTSDSVTYHCVECGNYDECPKCALKGNDLASRVSESASDLQLDLGDLKHVINSKGQKYSLNMGPNTLCPAHMSVKTSKYWDLSSIERQPEPHAYMEVTFEELAKDALVSVGVGNQIFAQNEMLGYQQNSFGVFNNGKASVNSASSVKSFFNMTYGKGDTIGVGVLFDSFNQRKAYFTKNGQYVGVIEDTLHKGMDCFPGVSFAKHSQVAFTVNFTGPFKFDANSIPNYREKQNSYISDMPNDVFAIIAGLSVISVAQAFEIRTVSKKFAEVYLGNSVWKALYLKNYNTQNPDLKIKSWFKFFKRRANEIITREESIENCGFEFECPLIWSNLQPSQNSPTERYCNKCEKTVYKVTDLETLRQYTEMGRCTVFANNTSMLKDFSYMDYEMGKRARPHDFVYNSPWD